MTSAAATPALVGWVIRKAATEVAGIAVDADLRALLDGKLDGAAVQVLRITVDPEYCGKHAWQTEIPLARRLLALMESWPLSHPDLAEGFEPAYLAAAATEGWAIAAEAVKIRKERNAVVAAASAAMLRDGLWSQ